MWGTEALPCVCSWRYSFWHRRLHTRQHDSLEICLQSLNLVAKQTISLVCRSMRKLWRWWVNLELSNSTVTTEDYTSRCVSAVVYQRDEHMSCWKPFWIWSCRLFQYCIRCDNNVITMCMGTELKVRFLSNAKQATLLCLEVQRYKNLSRQATL